MSKLSEIDLLLNGGDTMFTHMMAAMSILSDAQEHLEARSPTAIINNKINHAKAHLAEAMAERHHEKKLPGQFMVQKSREPIPGH